MNRKGTDRSLKFLKIFQFLGNLAIVYSSYYIVFYIGGRLGKPYNLENLHALNSIIPMILISYAVLFFIYRTYKIENLSFYEIFIGLFISLTILLILVLALSFFFRAFAFPRSLAILSFVMQLLFLSIFNYWVYMIYEKISSEFRVLLITNKGRHEPVFKTLYRKNLKIHFLNLEEEQDPIKKLDRTFNEEEFDIYIMDESVDFKNRNKIVKLFFERGRNIYIIPTTYELLIMNSKIQVMDELPLILPYNSKDKFELVIKRIIDIMVSLIALVFFSPLILIISILILIETGKPIFYIQRRVGLNGKVFNLIKFRTMIKDAEKFTGPVLSSEKDPRITKVGKFLRKTGFDEIPQFLNVLKGDMSIVGPRPERPELIVKILNEIPDFNLRLAVKPGITGFAQMYGKYDTPNNIKLKLDLIYIKQSFKIILDLIIMLNTIRLFFTPKRRR